MNDAYSVEEFVAKFCNQDEEKRLRIVSYIAHELTIMARKLYVINSNKVNNPETLRVYNEMQHKLLSYQIDLMEKDENRYPEEVLFNILFEMAHEGKIEKEFQYSIRKSFEYAGVTKESPS